MPGDCPIHACAAIYPDGEADMRDRRGASPSAHPWCTKKVSNLPWRLELDLQSSPKSQPLKIFSESRLQSVSKSAKHISTSYDHWLIKSLDSSMVLPFVFFFESCNVESQDMSVIQIPVIKNTCEFAEFAGDTVESNCCYSLSPWWLGLKNLREDWCKSHANH